MTLRPHFHLLAFALAALVLAAPATGFGGTLAKKSTARTSTHRLTRTHAAAKGESPRLVSERASETTFRPAAPVRAANGNIYVSRTLAQVPVQDLDKLGFVGISEPKEDPASGARIGGATPFRAEFVGANVRANDTAGDASNTTNSENSIAALGNQVVCGWNDGKNFGVTPGGSGFGYSSNGGLSFTDGGVPPVSSPALYFGDPSMTVDNAGNFYYANLFSNDGVNVNCITVNHGKFTGPSFAFDPPVVVAGPDNVNGLDKEWVAADPVGGNVYVTYTRFLATGGNQIEFTRSTNQGATWSPPFILTSVANESVQGSRVAVGPSGEIQVIYFVYDNATANNYMRTRRSTDGGITWGPEITLPTGPNGIFSNYGSGSAGFNRPRGIGFPSLAIDRTGGAYNGRVYATWEETFNFYFDPLGTLGVVNETENNGSQATANPITIGQEIHGTYSSTADLDFFSFTGTAGDKIILYLVPGGPTPGDGFMRMYCGGTAVANRYMLSYIGYGTSLIVATLPSSGTYYFRVSANTANIGNYIIYTGYHVPNAEDVARDQRDAIIQSSADGVTWDSRRVVNDDAPRFDNAFPEVAVGAAGQVYVDWMDHRGDACGIGTDVYYARSANGSASFLGSVKVNDGPPVNWNNVASNLTPNFGDYWGLTADGCNTFANFADGRQGSPDSWVAVINECAVPTEISLVSALADPDRVSIRWSTQAGMGGTVWRSEPDGAWISMGDVQSDAQGQIAYEDRTVSAGQRYGYRLGFLDGGTTRFTPEVWVDVPVATDFAIRPLASNPVTGDLAISFTLPKAAPARLELLDVTGRLVRSVTVGSHAGADMVVLGSRSTVQAGVYLVRLSQGSRVTSMRAVVVR